MLICRVPQIVFSGAPEGNCVNLQGWEEGCNAVVNHVMKVLTKVAPCWASTESF